jgi:UDP-N-acetylmuramoyl-tripeptide--D-alanyl-D-alanine ligase
LSPLAWIALVLGAATTLALLAGRLHLFLHLLQLEHYELRRLRVWVARRGERLAPRDLVLGAGTAALLVAAFAVDLPALAAAIAAAGLALAAIRARAVLARDQVKPLLFTPRATRLYTTAVALSVLALAVPVVLAALTAPTFGAIVLVGIAAALLLLTPELLGLANLAMRPVQHADNARFERRARRRLREVAPLVIGITGSYGKTTTKGCVAQVANLAGPTLPTPASFNSYLGVIRTINENLRPDHRTFVVEMGAYRRGDIAELCRLVEPRIGILTAIGPAHLERFGTLEQTTLAKGELAEELPADGVFITRADDARCRAAAERAPCPVRLFSPDPHPEATAWAENARLDEGRSRFDLCLREEGETTRHPVSARLLGRHNIANLLAAALAGVELGLAPEQIARALGRVTPPEHRLSPIVNRAAGIVVIDDAYNANPAGAEAALEVLAAHPGKRRVLVTPGMVELGDQEEAENERFGAAAAAVCDLVVLVGEKQSEPIRRGLEAAGFAPDALHTVADSGGAERLLAEASRAGDVILFENDLPDLYRGQAAGAETTAAAA